MLRMKRDLLDQQIIDAQGRKVVRVNDITFLKLRQDGGDMLRVLEVDIGIRSILRRVLCGVLPPQVIRNCKIASPQAPSAGNSAISSSPIRSAVFA